jgi:hypothetical protein
LKERIEERSDDFGSVSRRRSQIIEEVNFAEWPLFRGGIMASQKVGQDIIHKFLEKK